MTYYLWDEALPEIIEELDWSSITGEQWKAISDALDEHVSNSQDFMPPTPSAAELDDLRASPAIDALRHQVKAAEAEVEAFRNSVKRRRGAQHVWIEDGSVRYE
jgi:hypothetical protein